MTDVILTYPDSAPYRRIRDDVDTVLRGAGGATYVPTIKADDETDIGAALIEHVEQQGHHAEPVGGSYNPAVSVLVENGVPFQVGQDLMVFEIADNAILSWGLKPRTGVHALGWCEETSATNPVATAGITTKAQGSSFLCFYGGYTSNNAVPVDSKGNVLTLLDSSYYVPYGTGFQSRAYGCLNGIGGAGHTVSFTKNSIAAGEVSLALVEAINTDTIADSAVIYVGAGNPLVSGSVTVDRPAILIAAWFGDGGGQEHTAVPNNGFTVVESLLSLHPNLAVQCAFAVKAVDAGTYNVEWTETPDQGAALYLYALTNSKYP